MNAAEIAQLSQDLPDFEGLIETHISWVILTEKYAWKIKKPLQYSFLDFSSVEKRKAGCEKELALNQRLASDVYLKVGNVCFNAGKYQLTTENFLCENIVDYAVKMRRLDADLEMDKRLEAGEIGPDYMHKLAKMVADFHREATVISEERQSNAAIYRIDFNDILAQKAVFAEASPDAMEALESAIQLSDRFLSHAAPLIQQRLAAGFVRDVHGDLHAQNIFAYPAAPIIFDCIEFNDHFRQIDVLNEIAFFCMDLEATGHGELAQSFLENYLLHFPAMAEKGTDALFIWFKCYRANIRAKVNAIRAVQAKGPEKASAIAQMIHYLELMQRYAQQLPQDFD